MGQREKQLSNKRVAGVKLDIGTGLCGNQDYTEFLAKATLKTSKEWPLPEDNPTRAVYYNGFEGQLDSGFIFFHFKEPVLESWMLEYFEPEELIPLI